MTDMDPGGVRGMSRAAKKKRAKKQQQQQLLQPTTTTRHATNDDKGSPTTTTTPTSATTTRKRIRRDGKEEEEDKLPPVQQQNDDHSPLLDEVHSSEGEDDDELEMKLPPAADSKNKQEGVSTTDDIDNVQLPSDCHFLRDLLMLDEDGDDDGDDVSSSPFRSMTSRQRARCALQFLLQDTPVTHFYNQYWERKPLHVSARSATRLDGFLSLAGIREFTSVEKRGHKPLYYGKDLNVTRLQVQSDGVARRVTLDRVPPPSEPQGDNNNDDDSVSFIPVHPPDLWQHYDQDGCTVRLLCPHQHSASLHGLLSLLELEWGCMVGANAYLTPPHGAQGFAPHYDDIEAFCLQLEGRKRWKVYPPWNTGSNNTAASGTLPRVSSADYTEADLAGHTQPVLDVVLEPGDLLYMPRGWIHQACTLKDSSSNNNNQQHQHSLHVTISCLQQWAWADFLELLLPEALEATIASHVSLREGLPRCFLDYMGAQHDNRDLPPALAHLQQQLQQQQDEEDEASHLRRKAQWQQDFREAAKKRIMRVAKCALDLVDATCDQMGKRFLSDRVPPALTRSERARTTPTISLQPQHCVRLVRPGIARLVLENDKAVLYHCADISVVYHQHALSPMEFELDDGPAMEQLLTCVEPHWICVADLIHDTIEDKVAVAQALYDEGILALRPLA